MKISTKPKRVDDLLRFLRDGDYVAREAGVGLIEIHFDEGRRPPRLESELEMWSAVNRTEVRIVTNGGSPHRRSIFGEESPPPVFGAVAGVSSRSHARSQGSSATFPIRGEKF